MMIELSIEEVELIVEQYFRQIGWELLYNFSEKKESPKYDGQEDDSYCFVAFTAAP